MALPKFYVGQRVVALRDSIYGWFKKDSVYEIKAIRKCCIWMISIGAINQITEVCSGCNKVIGVVGSQAWHTETFFAPIHENFQAITFEKIVEKELSSVN